ncbi:putative pentatricopeptide repeat-containing protein [Senna tora]|uniref:Putative pentatricopeptide repeat-containing protein n=1 Tax=Senna tora TaxID=362788 RepID=A0A834SJ71_9FABA|nr:putative pentatricopeptide repeat-containing protein [Senna tora]
MLAAAACPNQYTLSTVFKCCSLANNLRLGKGLHGWILRKGIDADVVLENSMLDLYFKCRDFKYANRFFELMKDRDVVSWNIMTGSYLRAGDVEKSLDIFKNLPFKDVVTWNTIIDGLMQCGYERYALEQLYYMVESRVELSAVTFSIALILASSLSLVELGRQVHGRVLKFGMNGDGYIRSSLIEMYCKCGRMDKASFIIREIPLNFLRTQNSGVSCNEPVSETVSWSSMVSGYVSNGNYVDALKSFKVMVRELVIVDILTITSIISACANIGILEFGRLKEIGYSLDVELVTQDVDEEQGEVLIGHHSEKLAVVFGIINTGPNAPIRIMKNLRICTDCHNFIKYTSHLLQREITVRDIHRFHHFKHGSCSCGDYW